MVMQPFSSVRTYGGFGSVALRQSDLLTVLTEAARVCAEDLNVPFCKACRYRAAENDLLIEAGYGWHAVVGHVVSRADASSPQGRAFVLQTNIEQKKVLVDEKDRLLDQKKVL
jgi:hypothetical protein